MALAKGTIMTQTQHRGSITLDATEPRPHRLYRVAGWGGVGAFVSWALQPVIVAVSAATMEDGYPDWKSGVGGRSWAGGLEAAVFGGIAIGLLFFVLGTADLVRRSGAGRTVASRVGMIGGVIGAAGWLLAAGATMAQFTSVGSGLPEVAPDPDLQRALLQTLAIVLTGALVVTSIGMAMFTVFLVTAARRAGVIGWPLTIVGLVFLVAFLVPFAMPFSPPWGMIGFVLMLLIFGIAFLGKGRRAAADGA